MNKTTEGKHKFTPIILENLDNIVVTNFIDAKDVFRNRSDVTRIICLNDTGQYWVCYNLAECEEFYLGHPKSLKPIDEVIEPHVSDIRYYYRKFEEGDCVPDEQEVKELGKIEGMLKAVADTCRNIYENNR